MPVTPYATLKPRPTRKKPTKNGKPDGRGRPASFDKIRVVALGRDYQRVRFSLSEDILEKLIEMHEYDNNTFAFARGPISDRYKPLRLQFAPFVNLAIPAVLLRIEPPTTDPRGSKIQRRGRQFTVEILARRLRIKDGIQTQDLEHYWADLPGRNQLRGLIVNFHDDDMIFPGGKEKPDKYELDPNNFIVQ